MKRYFSIVMSILLVTSLHAQDDVYPSKEYKGLLFITNATIHVGNGQVISNGTVKVNNGKIEQAGTDIPVPAGDVKVFNVQGKHVYPGLILPVTNLGLIEVPNGGRPTADLTELGQLNPNIRSIVAYNTDSKVINTLRSNGILLAGIAPQGALLSGSSSVVQLDAWNWEDAAYKTENGIYFNMPNLIVRPNPFAIFFGIPQTPAAEALKRAMEQIEEVKSFFREAKVYFAESNHSETNLKFEAVKGLFEKKQKFFIRCDLVKEMLVAIDFVKEFGFDVVIAGGSESWQIPELLKQNNIAVILNQPHNLPTLADDDVDQPYKTASMLHKAGVLFAINDDDGQTRGRNLPFNAGTAAAYGLGKEEALSAITLNAAKILGIADKTGSIEAGKDANIVVSEGDILDMRSSIITHAFIQGRMIDLNDKHKQLYERYKHKYGLK